LETLRAAINWGMAQSPPFFNKSPFHRYGVRMSKKLETSRDRRLSCIEEKRLLDTALSTMSTAEHQFVGALLHDRIKSGCGGSQPPLSAALAASSLSPQSHRPEGFAEQRQAL